ncbi:hypothetical protein J2TS4_42460 [Paenibacillus sp. J2TS4]|nr:hypothetical protein J2TS4_42460 [Paenibacillus sp. J2TS4]
MIAFAVVPLILGLAMELTFRKTRLARGFFIFMLFVSIWQLDVAVLYGYEWFTPEQVDRLFRLFRFGFIMLGPASMYIVHIVYHDLEGPKTSGLRFGKLVSKLVDLRMIAFYYLFSFIVYLGGWSRKGVEKLYYVEPPHHTKYLYPIYGEYRFLIVVVLILFFVSLILCLVVSRAVINRHFRFFLLVFSIVSFFSYAVGVFNLSEDKGLYPSGIAVMIFSIALFAVFNRMNANTIEDMNTELIGQKEFLRQMIDLNPNYIYAKDARGNFTLANLATARLYGTFPADLIGRNENELSMSSASPTSRIWDHDRQLLQEMEDQIGLEETFIDAQGHLKWVRVSKMPIYTSKGKQLLCIATDITDYKRFQEQITAMAYHDSLTGLPNRLLYNDRLAEAIAHAEPGRLAVMFLDLDRFKMINDTFSHTTGDTLLKLVAERLLTCLRPTDTVSRRGGDEFNIILKDATKEEAQEIAKAILNVFDKPYWLDGLELYVSTSIGISMYPDDGADVETLIKNADTAMYRAKEKGKNHYQFYRADMNETNLRKVMLEKEMRKALETGDFKDCDLVYQPQVNMATGLLTGLEALLRWDHRELGLISPSEFIPIAEDSGLIVPLGRWAIKSACQQSVAWQKAGYRPVRVAVNLSPRQFRDEQLMGVIEKALEETGLEPSCLELEITENMAVQGADFFVRKLADLKRLGVQIVMDDFGTGYSSLSYLTKLPIHKLKIDRSFINGLTSSVENAEIVTSILSMAHKLNLKVIAEGVENEEQFNWLAEHGCDEVQGYLISRPLQPEQLERKGILWK